MSIPLDNVNEKDCPVVIPAGAANCPAGTLSDGTVDPGGPGNGNGNGDPPDGGVPSTDERCADPVWAAANPTLCEGFPELILKPQNVTICALGSVQFTAYVYANGVEVPVPLGVTYYSSNQGVLLIGAASGKATGIQNGGGIVTVSATWQGLSAFSQVTVLPDENCCDDLRVGMLLLIDTSKSMTQNFNGQFGSKLAYAKYMARAFADGLITSKDKIGVMSFNSGSTLVAGLSNDVAAIKASITSIPSSQNGTNLFVPLEDAANYILAQDVDSKVIILFTDGEYNLSGDPTPLADVILSQGAVLIVVAIRASGDAYDLLAKLGSGGFFISAHDAVATDSVDQLSGLKGYLCAGNCTPPGDVIVPRAHLNYTGFTNWDVTGDVDLIGGDPPYELYDLLPGNGLYLDLVGSSYDPNAPVPDYGKITSKTPFSIVDGHTYKLTFKLAGNQRLNKPGYTVRVTLDGYQDFTINDWKQDFGLYEWQWTAEATQDLYLSFEQTAVGAGSWSFGTLLDDITLEDLTDAVVMLSETFDTENPVYIPPDCGQGTVPGYSGSYGTSCYGYGCLSDPIAEQIPDPSPLESVEA